MWRKSVQLLSLVFSWGKYLVKTWTQCLLRPVSSGCRGNVPLPLRRGLSSSLQTNKEGPRPRPRQHRKPAWGQTLDGSKIDSIWLGSLRHGWRGHCHRERCKCAVVCNHYFIKTILNIPEPDVLGVPMMRLDISDPKQQEILQIWSHNFQQYIRL